MPRRLIKGRALLIWWSFEEDTDPYPELNERLRSWGRKARYFLSRSRWGRCFNIIR